jgi:hypothetical protein
MENDVYLKLTEGLRRLARVDSSDEIPTAAAVWSRSQFRVRYSSHRGRRRYTSTVATAGAALYLLFFLLWHLRPESIQIVVWLAIAVTVTSALLLGWMIRRKVDS